MNRHAIISLPHKHLRDRSKRIGIVTEEIAKLIEDMEAATLDWEANRDHEVGVALAAIQVDRPLRIVVIRNDFDNKENKEFTVFINPEIVKYEGTIEQDFEGCLSVPDVYGQVPRYTEVRIKARDKKGRPFRVTAKGFLARVFQHEIDHTNGILFIDHIKDKPEAFYRLREDGKLEKSDYDKDIRNNHLLW